MQTYRQILTDGLWHRNPGLIQFLGICPLLAVSNSLVNGLGLGLATIFVLVMSNFVVSLIRDLIPVDIRLPLFVLIIATLVTVVDLATQAWLFELWLGLGIFIPLIVTNCVILARAEAFASRHKPLAAIIDGLAHGLGFAFVLIALGAGREIIGNGTLFAGSARLFGDTFNNDGIVFADSGFLLALLPPGAFLGLGLLIALRNVVVRRTEAPQPQPQESVSS
ncbi:MAG: electron transport complex subunit E [Gammaproteobacteria bacterium]